MEWIDSSDSYKKRSILSILVKMAKADGVITAKEYRYLSILSERFGLEDKTLSALITTPIDDPLIPSNEQNRMTIMFYLLLLLKSDHNFPSSEERMIYHYGFKLGFRESLVRDFITVIKQYRAKALPPNQLIEVVKKYLN
jgi:uncharacterized tellurite resistance protein B-like protein